MKKIVFVFALMLSIAAFSQQEKLLVHYESTITLPEGFEFPSGPGAGAMPKEMQDRIKADLAKPQEYKLLTSNNESLYSHIEKISNDQNQSVGGRGPRMNIARMGAAGSIYKNVEQKEIIQDVNAFQKQYLIVDSLNQYKWQISKEKREILGIEVRKATSVNENMTATAWYAPSLSYKSGPDKFWGLPGLILEVEFTDATGRFTANRVITATSIEVAGAKDGISKPKKGKVVTQSQFDKLQEEQRKKSEEMRNDGVDRRN